MKKVSLILTTLALAAILLAACGGQGTSTSVPGTNVPPAASTSEATATAASGAAMTGTAGIPVTGENSPNRLSNLMDYEVRNQKGDQIGSVKDMVLDFDNASIAYVVVGAGGFLGLGEKNILVPWKMLQLQKGDQPSFVFQGSQDAYKNFPDMDLSTLLPGKAQPAKDWDAAIKKFWQNGGTANANGQATNTPENTANMTATPLATAVPGVQKLQGVLLASDLLKATVEVNNTSTGTANGPSGSNTPAATQAAGNGAGTSAAPAATATVSDLGTGNSLGTMDLKVDDVIVNPNAGKVQYVVLTGAFTDGQRTVAMPLKYLLWDGSNEKFSLGVNSLALVNAPAFENGQYPDFSSSDWSSKLDQYWNNLKSDMLVKPAP